ncbi:MAG: insulinase family protein, partial [Propionibacteriaceae bacterium]|nr:insulinase family protein [Propionibacteriaceae bacterium]
MNTRHLSYELHRHQLDNGLRVVVSPDPWVPVVAVNLWYDVGSAHESPGRTGFAHLFEHLMFAGAADVGPGEHLGALQALGGEVNATTSFDRTNYFETVPAGAAELALWYEAQRLGSLLEAVDQTVLDTEREVVKEEKRQRYDNVPYGDVMELILGQVFPEGHPYRHTVIGSMDDLNAAGVE